MANGIEPIVMPKWGLAMTEGMVNTWSVDEAAQVNAGDEICEIETSKLANMFESPASGPLRRRVATEGEILPVGALIAVIAEASVSDDEVDAFVKEFQENFVPEETDDDGPEPETITVDGKKIVYLKLGDSDANPVVMLHGFGADMNGWLFNQGALSEDAPVYAVDLPGHGKSEKDVGEGSINSLAATVERFLEEASLSNVHLVGHSLGGGVALQVAAGGSASVKSLTLISPVGLGDEINREFLDGYVKAKRQKHLKPVLEQLVSDKSLISSDMMDDVFKFKRIDGVVDGLNKLIETNFTGGSQAVSLRSQLSDVVGPITIVWGKEDEIIPVSHSENLPDNINLHLLDNSGHVPQMENAAQVNQIIKSVIGG